MCIDFLPDGRLLIVDSARRRLLCRDSDGSLATYADLAAISEKPWNGIVVDAYGNAYVNNIGFDFPGGDPGPGIVVLVTSTGAVRQVADDLAFPNGMAITEDGDILIVAESHGNRLTAYDIGQDGDLHNRRTWADTGGDHPTGSVSTPWEPSGTPTWPTTTACVCARAARCWRPSSLTEEPSLAPSAAATSPSCTSSARSTGATPSRRNPQGRSSPSQPRHPALGTRNQRQRLAVSVARGQ